MIKIANKIIICLMIINFYILLLSRIYKTEATNSYFQYVKSGIEQFPYSYREELKTLAKKYPNWNFQAYYTGISWGELIQKERDEKIHRNRIDAKLSEVWKHCDFEDDGWACASDEAVKYYLDPRNFLNETQIFQFVETSYNSKSQTLNEIQKSVKGTFLDNKITCKDFNNNLVTITYSEIILEAAKKTNISAFYIKNKIIQEVGTTGSGSTSGKYPGHEGYYNFFNYGAFDEGDDIANGLIYAKEKGWDSQYKAIIGGAELIGKYYINQGQNTPYFNKWDVVGTKILKDGESLTVSEKDLFWHQYMTNIQDPYSQAISNKKLYGNSLQNEITFIIPIYDNMPQESASKPTDLYSGNINTELINIENIISSNGDNYIGGSIYIAEWVGDDCRIPKGIPDMTLKSTDGTFSKKMYVAYIDSIKYYYDVNIKHIDINKSYYIEVKLSGNNNISPEENKTQIARLPNKTLKKDFKERIIKTKNNKIVFDDMTYIGKVNTELYKMNIIQNAKGDNYLSGFIYIAEWIDGECKTPLTKPQITLKSTSGKIEKEVYVSYEGGIKYYFDRNLEKLDVNEEYYLEVKLINDKNIATDIEKTQMAKITPKGKIGICTNGNIVKVRDNYIEIKNM